MKYDSKLYPFSSILTKKEYMGFLTKHISLKENYSVLDVGCGKGRFVKHLQERVPNAVGIDCNSSAINNGLCKNLFVMDVEDLKFEDNSFDVVCSFHTIEHVPHPDKMMKEIERVLKPGGTAFIAYPAEPIRGMFSLLSAFLLYKNPFKTRQIHLHKFRPSILSKLVEENTNLQHMNSKFYFFSFPQFLSIFKKNKE